jgi:hypothetical protein
MADKTLETSLVIKAKTKGFGKVDEIRQNVEELGTAAADAAPSLEALGNAVEEVASAGGGSRLKRWRGQSARRLRLLKMRPRQCGRLEKAVANAVDEIAAAAGAEGRLAQGADKMSSAIGRAATQLGVLKHLALGGIGVSSLSVLSDMVDEYDMLSDDDLKLWHMSPLAVFDMWQVEQETGDPRQSVYIGGDDGQGA